MRVWTVANQKGGVGKTTTSVALAGIAASNGCRTLLLDLDPHGSLTCYFRQNPDSLPASTFTLFEQREHLSYSLVNQLIISTAYDNMHLIPATTALATLERKVIGEGMGLVLSKALALAYSDFDLAVIDCPPQLGVLMVNALAACSQLIVPVQTEFLAIHGLERMLHTLNMLARSRNSGDAIPYLIVPTMYDRRTAASVNSLRTIRNNYGDYVWPAKIPIDTRLRDASKAGVPPHLFDPDGRAVDAYRSLFKVLTAGQPLTSHATGKMA